MDPAFAALKVVYNSTYYSKHREELKKKREENAEAIKEYREKNKETRNKKAREYYKAKTDLNLKMLKLLKENNISLD
jgi:hypothetical protein